MPYLVEPEGTSCENLPETHAVIKAIRRHVDAHYTNRMLLAEANQLPAQVTAYFGNSDECHMAYHFPLMPRLFIAIHQESREPIADALVQTPVILDDCRLRTVPRPAWLLAATLRTIMATDTGVREDGALAFELNLPVRTFPVERKRQFLRDLGSTLRRLPGLKALGMTLELPGRPAPLRAEEVMLRGGPWVKPERLPRPH